MLGLLSVLAGWMICLLCVWWWWLWLSSASKQEPSTVPTQQPKVDNLEGTAPIRTACCDWCDFINETLSKWGVWTWTWQTFLFFRLFLQRKFPHEVSATSEKSQGFPWFEKSDVFQQPFRTPLTFLRPLSFTALTLTSIYNPSTNLYILYINMRKEHGESKCSQNERHIWNLNKCFFFGFGHSETWVHQTFTSLCCVLWPRGFPRGPTRRDATQALAFGEVMQVDWGRWRLKTQNCRKVMMIDAHGFVCVPFKTTRCQDSLRRWNQNGMVNICRVIKQRWWNYSEFQSWNGWHRTLVSAQSHIIYLSSFPSLITT